MSDQTERDEEHGEIDERVMSRNLDGTLALGPTFRELAKETKEVKTEADLRRLREFIVATPGCETSDLTSGLAMSKKYILQLLERMEDVEKKGKGVKNDPLKYYVRPFDYGEPQGAVQGLINNFGNRPLAWIIHRFR